MIRRFFAERITHPQGKIIATLAILGIVALRLIMGYGCPIQTMTGIPCPGCGMTRALFLALKLDFTAAFDMHAMFWSIPILYLYLLCDGKLIGKKAIDALVLGLIGAGFLINWGANLI